MNAAISSLLLILLACSVFTPLACRACTDFRVETTDGAYVNGRSMEWGDDMHSKLIARLRGEQRQSMAPGGAQGLAWKSKYGYVGVNVYDLDAYVDGMNEKGLSFGALWLPHYTKYQEIAPNQFKSAINVLDLGAWLLGNFSTVDEARSAIGKVRVWSDVLPSFGGIPTAHVSLHDASGKSLVIEFIDGQQRIYVNPVSILTNAPPFDWQLINLGNYLNVSPDNAKSIKAGASVLAPAGEGSGLFGIPGDWTPPSRFVRTAAMLAFSHPAKTAGQGVNLAEHILNAVDIPQGVIREKVNGKDYCDYTQWVVIKDLSNRVLYFRSYDNLTLRSLDLKKLDFSPGAKTYSISIAGGDPVQALTPDRISKAEASN